MSRTLEETARATLLATDPLGNPEANANVILAALRNAVADEREACVVIARRNGAFATADEIRSRKDTP